MTAVLIPTADEAEWLQARRQGVTASEIAVLLGISPYSSPYALYHHKRGTLDSQPDSAVMERGRVLEPYIRDKWQEANPGLAVLGDGRDLWRHGERPWQMATPDGVVHDVVRDTDGSPELGDPCAVLECKVDGGSDEWGEEGSDEIPVHYRAQVLWQMDVMGVGTAYVACLRVRDWRIREYVITHDESPVLEYPHRIPGPDAPQICRLCGDLELMRGEAQEFMKRLESGDEPDVDYRPATLGALKTLNLLGEDEETAGIGPQLADRYEAACRNAKHWEQRKRLYEARIRQRAGNARRIVRAGPAQIPVARRDVYDVREHVRKASHVDKLVLTPPKEKKS